ncbi:MAG: cytochrome P460 family protein [Planctomycetota bacterium]|nr:cytochrome P460 family protein [Planctomycetota bacterium]
MEIKKGAKSPIEAPAVKDGKRFAPGKQKDLFIMLKVDPKTPGTDQGWIYGTVTPDGKTVTSAGRVQSCMKCHVKIKDRLFGQSKS